MGAARGIDEGLISGTFNSPQFQNLLGLDPDDERAYANIKGNVSAMVQIGNIAGAGLALVSVVPVVQFAMIHETSSRTIRP